MSPHIYTASEAAALLATAEAGPYTAPGEDGVIWPARETALDPIGAVSSRLDEAQTAANGALLAASWDLAASVVHHAERADRAEAEIERLQTELRGDQAHVAAAARARERDEALAEVDRLRIDRDRYIREAESLRAAAHANTSGAI